jgi:ketosteroid isomerase-like protein
MKNIFIAFIMAAILFSCKQQSPETAIAKAPVDSLIANWSNSWNNHDSAAVRDLFLADALLIDDNLIASNMQETSDKWIQPNINAVLNFKASTLQQWSTSDRAGYTGNYEFDYALNDSAMAKAKGVFTVNWIKTDKGDWKITNADIHSIH